MSFATTDKYRLKPLLVSEITISDKLERMLFSKTGTQ